MSKPTRTFTFRFPEGYFCLTEAGSIPSAYGNEPVYRISAFVAQGQRYQGNQRPLELFTPEVSE